VKAKARAVAQSIVQKHNPNPVPHRVVDARQGDERECDESSDEEDDTNPVDVDEDLFDDLISFREFLIGGEPFLALRTQVRAR
jgi:hypothetical protein